MAIKRSFSAKNGKNCICLKCGVQIVPETLKDDSIYTCTQCGQKMTVDKYKSHIVLTILERQDLRRRIEPEIMNIPDKKEMVLKLVRENGELRDKNEKAYAKIKKWQKEAKKYEQELNKWQQAAEGLAHMIEEMREKESANDSEKEAWQQATQI